MKRIILLFIFLPALLFAQNPILYSDTLPYRGKDFKDTTTQLTYVEIIKYENGCVWVHINLTPDENECVNHINIPIKRFRKKKDGYFLRPYNNDYNIMKIISSGDGVLLLHRYPRRYQHWLVFHKGIGSGEE